MAPVLIADHGPVEQCNPLTERPTWLSLSLPEWLPFTLSKTRVRYLLSLLPSNNRELSPSVPTDNPADRRAEALAELVAVDPGRSYDM